MNRHVFYLLQLDRHLVQILLIIVTSFFLLPKTPILCEEATSFNPIQKTEIIPFRDRLQHYVDLNTREVIEDLLARERQLLSLIRNIHKEIRLRDKALFSQTDNIFFRLGVQSDTLIAQYEQELVYLIKLYDDLLRLRRIADFGDDINAQMMLAETKQRLFKTVEDAKLMTKSPLTKQHIADMVKAYTMELDSLLNIYDHLQRLENDPRLRGDDNAAKRIRNQKVRLFKTLAQWGKWGPLSEKDFLTLQNELQHLTTIFANIDTLTMKAHPDHVSEIEMIKRSLMDRVDRTVYDLMNSAGYRLPSFPTVSEFIDAWKKKRIIDIEVKLTEYQTILNYLITNATEAERQRMMARDIDDAMLSYTEQQYHLCEYQIQAILKLYDRYLINKTALLYYLAECRYARGDYDAAAILYQQVILDDKDTSFIPQALIRLMQYCREGEKTEEFLNYYQQLINLPAKPDQEMLWYAHFLAAEELLGRRQFKEAIATLNKISPKCDLYWYSQLLLGIAYANLQEVNRAERIFKKIADVKSYPWTDLRMAYLRNTALIRLAFIYYQQGEYERAIETFQKVSKGYYEYDKALIGQAWANLRLGRVNQTIQKSEAILANYLTSNFQYEALVLAGYCKQLIGQEDDGMDEYRYVLRAGAAMETEKNYHKERRLTLQQAKSLRKLEQEALEKRRLDLYQEIEALQLEIDAILNRLPTQDDQAMELIEEYGEERRQILENLNKLDAVISWAKANGQIDIAGRAERQRSRLMKILDVYQADRNITHTNILVDFPLAARESSRLYKSKSLDQIQHELETEKRHLEQAAELVGKYSAYSDAYHYLTEKNDLTILQQDLERLQNRISMFGSWLNQQESESGQTNLDYWSSLSAFYLSDMIDKKRTATKEDLNENAQRIKVIQDLFKQKKNEIESRLESFTQDIKAIQNNLLLRKNQLDLLERKTYFEKYYFDTKEREEEFPLK